MLNNKYTKWYLLLVKNRQENKIIGEIEKHHIIPKSLGGPNTKDNIVNFTIREHYIAHLLLTKMYTGDANKK